MAAQRARTQNDDEYDIDGFGIGVVREEGRWRCFPMPLAALTSLSEAETELRELRSSGATFGLLDVDDEFFVIVRPGPAGTHLLISDAAAAIDYDIAADVLEKLNVEVPDLDPDELDETDPWEEGELGILADLGLPEPVMGVILAETDLYPDEQLQMIAERLGFEREFAAVVDSIQK
ncbi:tRNA adenosine deaminase-associated protein [Hoyosella altamirensis]|uniref:Putative tRNA adenosine deaminase-associated protein n=1 Tax=Hoyosella altamirensis TaxID=616997 RepID=A0A839RNL4_9ACTN|nr:tRNA adenosine deaminase-associated protein [Hoyosella altamirensis]MBB3037899.1 putative tRNA adenosine deaminase-associated protein [Hoyosella altamirensis]